MGEQPLALVTGASRGIGAAVAAALADSHELLLGGRDLEALRRVADQFPNARAWPVELTDDATGIHRLDVLVHSAGISRRPNQDRPINGQSILNPIYKLDGATQPCGVR